MSDFKDTNRYGSDGVNNQEKIYFTEILREVHIQVQALGIYRFIIFKPTINILIVF